MRAKEKQAWAILRDAEEKLKALGFAIYSPALDWDGQAALVAITPPIEEEGGVA